MQILKRELWYSREQVPRVPGYPSTNTCSRNNQLHLLHPEFFNFTFVERKARSSTPSQSICSSISDPISSTLKPSFDSDEIQLGDKRRALRSVLGVLPSPDAELFAIEAECLGMQAALRIPTPLRIVFEPRVFSRVAFAAVRLTKCGAQLGEIVSPPEEILFGTKIPNRVGIIKFQFGMMIMNLKCPHK
eukprot:3187696-Rhodomonas_salina.1